jgi:8-oxo-dGTP pyrophosphatase MutT (NUDIX family)
MIPPSALRILRGSRTSVTITSQSSVSGLLSSGSHLLCPGAVRVGSSNYVQYCHSFQAKQLPCHAFGLQFQRPNSSATIHHGCIRYSSASRPESRAENDALPIRRVVSSFLTTGGPHTSSFRVALFRRSENVKNYPGLWAACSGSIEDSDASPRAAALREVREETGLEEGELELLGMGASTDTAGRIEGGHEGDAVGERNDEEDGVVWNLIDEKLGVRWQIWGFVWRWTDRGKVLETVEGAESVAERLKQKINLDWEHEEVRLVRMHEMKGMKTVDGLSKNLESALARIPKC